MPKNFDVIIVGGGLVGGVFALDLAEQNPQLNLAIIESTEQVPEVVDDLDNRIYAIAPANVAYLKHLRVWPGEDRIGTINTMDVSGDMDANILFERDVPRTLFLAKTVESKYLSAQLYQRLHDTLNITFIYDKLEYIVDQQSHMQLTTSKNDVYQASLIVGADGANSVVRTMAHLDIQAVDYQESGVVANFSCELPHDNTAYQWFKDNSVLAYLPLPGNKISIVWSTANAKEMLNMVDAEFADWVAKASQYKLGKLTVLTNAVAFPLKMYLLDKVYANKIVLIGDAAHTIHPLAGQGVNLGFKDAKLLASILGDCKSYQIGDSGLLAKYNAMRLPYVRQMQLACHSLRRLFTSGDFLITNMRNSGLNWVNSCTWLKNRLIKNTQ